MGMINVKSVSKSFGMKEVLRDINLDIEPGEFTAIVGPNGSGKSTLLRIISPLLRPNSGQVTVAGLDLNTKAHTVRQILGVVSHHTLLYDNLTAYENLLFYAHLYSITDYATRINMVLDKVNLTDSKDTLVRTYSHGMQQRLSIARAILHNPRVILFDEPHTGLDQTNSIILDKILQSRSAAGNTVMLITHDIKHALALCDKIVVLHKGKVEYQERTTQISYDEFASKYHEITNV